MQNKLLHTRLSELEKKWLNGTITPQEASEYMEWYNRQEHEAVEIPEMVAADELTHRHKLFQSLQSKIDPKQKNSITKILQHKALRYAAVLMLIAGTGTYLWNNFRDRPAAFEIAKETIIVPGRETATLTLANGRVITLDSIGNGMLAQEGSSTIIKMADGKIVYEKNNIQGAAVMNTMSTPRGGKYQLILPDGSEIWLNSASTVYFPSFFNGKERRILVSGEVYIEVKKNAAQPFIVDVKGGPTVEVLGTSFNINSYADEADITTTLLSGSVRVQQHNKNYLLKPGQQLKGNRIAGNINTAQAIAWKEGIFNFNDITVPEAMRQLSRWYDLEVTYEDKLPTEQLRGKIPMNASIGQVLKTLENIGIRFRIEGKKIIIKK